MDAIDRYVRSLERAHGGTGPPSRGEHVRQLCLRTGIPRALTEFSRGLRRGRCRKRRCDSRYGIVRVTVDTRDPERIDRSAVLECALCGHTWTAVRMPDLSLRDGAATRVVLTLILPPRRGTAARVWYNRMGNAVWSGADAQTVANATYTQLIQAGTDHAQRAERSAADREELRRRNADALAAEVAASREQLARIDAQLVAVGSPLA